MRKINKVSYIARFLTSLFVVIFSLYSFDVSAKKHSSSGSKNFASKLCEADPATYVCHKLKRGENWEKLFPKGERLELMKKINRRNLDIYQGMVIAIPRNENATLLDVAPFKKEIDPPGEKIIFVSINDLAWGAYNEGGTLVNWGPISSGKDWCGDVGRGCRTATGKFKIYQKQGFGCYSTKFPVGRGGAPMPYCMFFHGGYALHGSYDVPGYNASHGCVRLFINDAKWLNREFVGDEKVRVHVNRNN